MNTRALFASFLPCCPICSSSPSNLSDEGLYKSYFLCAFHQRLCRTPDRLEKKKLSASLLARKYQGKIQPSVAHAEAIAAVTLLMAA
uniref:Putative secreted protein n=1 Tax=Ixodes ricinus TaxID=34613 RepID=A0A6B0TZ02_IXORI